MLADRSSWQSRSTGKKETTEWKKRLDLDKEWKEEKTSFGVVQRNVNRGVLISENMFQDIETQFSTPYDSKWTKYKLMYKNTIKSVTKQITFHSLKLYR